MMYLISIIIFVIFFFITVIMDDSYLKWIASAVTGITFIIMVFISCQQTLDDFEICQDDYSQCVNWYRANLAKEEIKKSISDNKITVREFLRIEKQVAEDRLNNMKEQIR